MSRKHDSLRNSRISLQRYIYRHHRTQKDFAKAINACPTSVVHWFTGRSLPSPEHMVAIYHLTKTKFSPNYWYLRLPKEIAARNKKLAEAKSLGRAAQEAIAIKLSTEWKSDCIQRDYWPTSSTPSS